MASGQENKGDESHSQQEHERDDLDPRSRSYLSSGRCHVLSLSSRARVPLAIQDWSAWTQAIRGMTGHGHEPPCEA